MENWNNISIYIDHTNFNNSEKKYQCYLYSALKRVYPFLRSPVDIHEMRLNCDSLLFKNLSLLIHLEWNLKPEDTKIVNRPIIIHKYLINLHIPSSGKHTVNRIVSTYGIDELLERYLFYTPLDNGWYIYNGCFRLNY